MSLLLGSLLSLQTGLRGPSLWFCATPTINTSCFALSVFPTKLAWEQRTCLILSLLLLPLCGEGDAPHSSSLAWKIPCTEEPGRLQSMGSRRVGHDWATSLSLFTFLHRRRKWQPTPVFLPGESQARGSLVGCRLWGRTESDTTAVT